LIKTILIVPCIALFEIQGYLAFFFIRDIIISESISNGAYEEQDLERVRTNDLYLKCFLRSFGDDGDLKKPLEMIDSVLVFRKKLGVNGMLFSIVKFVTFCALTSVPVSLNC
jgi:hypothetical protein